MAGHAAKPVGRQGGRYHPGTSAEIHAQLYIGMIDTATDERTTEPGRRKKRTKAAAV